MGEKIAFSHFSVLLKECLEALNIQATGTYVDCTTGGAGHSGEILQRLGKGGKLFCFDKDLDALRVAEERLTQLKKEKNLQGEFFLVHADFSHIEEALRERGIDTVQGILADLGVSSYQLDEASRGFAYMKEGPLDMRMDQSQSQTAADLVNGLSEEKLVEIFYLYGEEKYAKSIARGILKRRQQKLFETTQDLVDCIFASIPSKARNEAQHPAKRVFQALRIALNEELSALEKLLDASARLLKKGGRLAIISFHSLEDRRVKEAYRSFEKACVCPRHFPLCVCQRKSKGKALDKGLVASQEELEINPRSRSARLRTFEFFTEENE